MEGQILVTTEELLRTAEEFSSQGSSVQTLTSEMLEKVRSLSSTWEGEAAQDYLAKFASLEDDIQKMLRMINEHVIDLRDMANAYRQAEQQNVDVIQSLSGDVIV